MRLLLLMSEARTNYAPDELVRRINAAGPRLSAAQYIYYREEAEEPFYALLHEADWIMAAIPGLLELRGSLSFAVAGRSNSPFQICKAGDDEFVLLIDARAFYLLLTLCYRLQSLPPLCNILENDEKEQYKDYSGMCLLDITKDITFHTDDIESLVSGKAHQSIYRAALTYIFGHEIAHVSHGHLEFILSPEFAEFSSTQTDRDLTLRTLEMDADSSATSSVSDVFEHILRLQGPETKQTYAIPPMLLRAHYVTGAFIALIYMDTLASNHMPKSHPIGYARFLTTSGVFQRIFEARCPEAVGLPDQLRAAITEAFIRLSGSLENLWYPMASNVHFFAAGSDQPVALYDEIGVGVGLQELEPLHGRWARIRPRLEARRRGGRLAPPSSPAF